MMMTMFIQFFCSPYEVIVLHHISDAALFRIVLSDCQNRQKKNMLSLKSGAAMTL